MRIFLSGGSGFIGRATGARLTSNSHEVWSLARSEKAAVIVEAWGGIPVEGNLTEQGPWQDAIGECDAVIHCAAKVGDWGNRSDFRQVNVVGTGLIVEGALKNGTRLVHVSSIAAQGGRGHFDESSPIVHRRHPYSDSKAAAEEVVDAGIERGLDAVHVRVANVYGPDDPYLMPRLVEQATTGRFFIVGDGTQPSNLIYVDDVAGALEAALHCEWEPGERFLITDPDSPTISDAVKIAIDALGLPAKAVHIPMAVAVPLALAGEGIGRLTGRRPAVTLYSVLGLGGVRRLDNRHTIERLSWSPSVSFREGVRITVASYLERSEP